MYYITYYSKLQAKKLGVEIKHSKNPKKKLDVFKKNKKIASIGSIGYLDFPTMIKKFGIKYALKRKKAYYLRHKKNIKKIGSVGYYSAKILW